jgi:hypothetical protein
LTSYFISKALKVFLSPSIGKRVCGDARNLLSFGRTEKLVEIFCGIRENKTFVVTAKTQFPVQVDKSHLLDTLTI